MMTRWVSTVAAAASLLVLAAAPAGAYDWVRWEAGVGGNGHEYALITSIMEFLPAEAIAVSGGGHLATVNDQAENDWIVAHFGSPPSDNYIGIGLTDDGHEGVWKWISGETAAYTRWHPGEPNGGTSENYAVLYTRGSRVGYWADVDDGPPGGQYWLMERVSGQPPTLQWIPREGTGHEYALITTLMECATAQTIATSEGACLVEINDQAENDWIVGNFGSPPTDNYVGIGLSDVEQEGTWKWACGAPVTFTGWYPGEPNGGASENYAVLYTRGSRVGYWADVDDGPPGGQYWLLERTAAVGEVKVIFPGPDIPALCPGNRYAIGWWTSPGITDVRIDLYYFGSLEKTLVARTPNDGKWIWEIPASQHLNSDYRIRVGNADDARVFGQSGEFGVGTCPPFVCFQMKYPFDDVQKITAIQGKPFPVTWSKCALEAAAVKIELWYLDQVETVLAASAPNTGYFVWDVPADQHPNSDYRIVIVDAAEKRHKAATTEFSVGRDTVPADLDGDEDVDLNDFTIFQACFNGPNRPPACP